MTESTCFNDHKSRDAITDYEKTIDLVVVSNLAGKKISALISVIGASVSVFAIVTVLFIPKTYDSTAVLYLTPLVLMEGTVDYYSMKIKMKLVNSVVALIKQDNIMDYVAEENGFEDADVVRDVLEITSESNKELIDKAITQNPKLSQAVAEYIAGYSIDTMPET